VIAGDRHCGATEYFEFFQAGAWDTVLLEAWERRAACTRITAPLVIRLAFVNTIIVWCAPNPVTLEHSPSLLPPLGEHRPVASRFIRVADLDAREGNLTVTFTMSYKERIRNAQPSSSNTPTPPRKPPVSLEFEWAGGVERIRETFRAKGNIHAARPYIELKGGALAGWLALQVLSAHRISVRFEYQPHLVSPADALATFRLLSALGESGRLRNLST
jgi:hypothetical protein